MSLSGQNADHLVGWKSPFSPSLDAILRKILGGGGGGEENDQRPEKGFPFTSLELIRPSRGN